MLLEMFSLNQYETGERAVGANNHSPSLALQTNAAAGTVESDFKGLGK